MLHVISWIPIHCSAVVNAVCRSHKYYPRNPFLGYWDSACESGSRLFLQSRFRFRQAFQWTNLPWLFCDLFIVYWYFILLGFLPIKSKRTKNIFVTKIWHIILKRFFVVIIRDIGRQFKKSNLCLASMKNLHPSREGIHLFIMPDSIPYLLSISSEFALKVLPSETDPAKIRIIWMSLISAGAISVDSNLEF